MKTDLTSSAVHRRAPLVDLLREAGKELQDAWLADPPREPNLDCALPAYLFRAADYLMLFAKMHWAISLLMAAEEKTNLAERQAVLMDHIRAALWEINSMVEEDWPDDTAP